MIKFWPVGGSHYQSHSGGLTPIQAEFLQGLKAKDRFVIFVNDDGSLTLKKSKLEANPEFVADDALHNDESA